MNNWDKYNLGPTPCDEECIPYPYRGREQEAIEECARYRNMLDNRFRNLPHGVRFVVTYNPYDAEGGYHEVAIQYNMSIEDHNDAMLFVEDNLPEVWDDDTSFDVMEYLT